jgi:predicted oxidoreductase
MEFSLSGSALTALFVGMVWALVKTVEYFVSRRNGRPAFYGEYSEQLQETHQLTKELHELHEVYDENHVPLWYVPREMLTLVREIHTCMENSENQVGEIKSGQAVLFEKITELIASQMLLTQRLGDLVAKLDRISN